MVKCVPLVSMARPGSKVLFELQLTTSTFFLLPWGWTSCKCFAPSGRSRSWSHGDSVPSIDLYPVFPRTRCLWRHYIKRFWRTNSIASHLVFVSLGCAVLFSPMIRLFCYLSLLVMMRSAQSRFWHHGSVRQVAIFSNNSLLTVTWLPAHAVPSI